MKGLLFIAAFAVALAAAVMTWQTVSDPGSAQREVAVADRAGQLRQGAYLARAGNCMACHTAQGGAPYAGGRALATPFGTMYAPNLTPEAETGIARWTADDFWRAMHNGKSKDGSFLYPAFPYPNYTKMTRADSDALFAYLRTVAPVRQVRREHTLRFPYNVRPLLAFWRALYFSPGQYQPQEARGALWNRGAYLVQGLGHCSACHAGRNALGASLGELRLDGGAAGAEGWHAPPLGGVRDRAELADLLQHGSSASDAVYGPMAQVVAGSLQHLALGDIDAMTHYLVSLPGPRQRDQAPDAAALGAAAPQLQLGRQVYDKQCASCHGEQGQGKPGAYPRLAGTGTRDPGNAIRMILQGGYAPSTAGNPRPYGMPPFGAELSDAEVAAVLSHVNTSWGNRGPLVTVHEAGRLRGGN